MATSTLLAQIKPGFGSGTTAARELADIALSTAKDGGATYADFRLTHTQNEDLAVRNGEVARVQQCDTLGFGVRVIRDGCWGFAAGTAPTGAAVKAAAKSALEMAKAAAAVAKKPLDLADEPPAIDRWQTPVQIDPFTVPVADKFALLFAIDEELRKATEIRVSTSSMRFERIRQRFITSAGADIDQEIVRSGAGFSVTAVGEGDVQTRSYPNSFGGQYIAGGYELVKALDLLSHAAPIREQAIELLTAKLCPSGKTDLIIGGAQLGLQIHESVGHPLELDRVLGMEANFAGTSFATLEKHKTFQYGSKIVNLVADGTVAGGLATAGYDDDGVAAQRWHVVRDGVLQSYFTNRELAHVIADTRSRGCNRADSPLSVPIIRIPNLSLMPGAWTLDGLIADTQDGIFMDVNRSW
jgi:TldD protein